MNFSAWQVVFAAVGGLIGLGIGRVVGPQLHNPKLSESAWSAIGTVCGLALAAVAWYLIKYIPVLYFRLKPRTTVSFVSFSATYRFLPSQRVKLPFTFVRRRIQGKNILKTATAKLSKGSVVIWAAGGAGKTALAAAALCRIHPGLRGGSIWISAEGRSLVSFLAELAIQLGCREAQDVRSAVRLQLMALGNCLLVVDNLETAHQDVTDFLIQEVPANSRLLITTRHWNMQNTGRFFDEISLGPSDREASRFGVLFLRQLVKKRNTRLLRRAETDILEAAHGNPKAIELLVGQVEARGSLAPIVELQSGQGTVLDNVIGRSITVLDSKHRPILSALSLFMPHARKSSLEDVAGTADVEEHLEALWKWRLAEHDDTGEQWWVSDQVRAYVSKLPDSERFRLPFARHFLRMAMGKTQTQDWDATNPALDAQRKNLFSAMDWCSIRMKQMDENGKDAAGLLTEFLRVLYTFLYDVGYWEELFEYAKQAVEVACQLLQDEKISADMTYVLGMAYDNKSNFEKAEELYTKSLDLKEKLKDKKGEADVLHQLGILAQMRGNYKGAEQTFKKSLLLRREAGDIRNAAFALHRLGMVAHILRGGESAKPFFDEGLGVARGLSDGRGMSYNLDQLGVLAHEQGDLVGAEKYYRKSLELKEGIRHERGIAYTQDRLGVLAYDRGNLREAEHLLEQSLERKTKLGNKRDMAYTLHRMGMVAQNRGKMARADELYKRALDLRRSLPDKKGTAETLVQIAELRQQQRKLQEAKSLLREALALYDDLDFERGKTHVQEILTKIPESQ